MSAKVRVRARLPGELLRQARNDQRVECCGLLAGRGGIITAVLPATNALASPAGYEIAPRELFSLFRGMRAEGLDHMGIYHSHPAGDNVPSPRDIEQAFYPGAAYFIISPRAGAPRPVRAFSIRDGCAEELEIIEVAE